MFLAKMTKRKTKKFLFFLMLFCMLFSSLSLIPLQNNSFIGSAKANFFKDFSIADEKELGRKFEVLVKTSLPLVEDPVIKNYVAGIMKNLLQTLPPQPFQYEANVVYSPVLNAFASPGGFIFVFTGLMNNLENEAQLAGIMAHEIAHVTQRHIAAQMDKNKFISLGTLAGMLAGALAGGDTGNAIVTGAAAVGQAAQLKYSRLDEDDADKFALRYLTEANYNPVGLGEAFGILQSNSFNIGSDFPTYLSTHPALNSRMATVQAYAKSLNGKETYRPLVTDAFLRAKAMTMANYADERMAIQYFQDNLKKNAKDAISLMGLAIIADSQHKRLEAEKLFEEALHISPKDPLILREAGNFYYGKSDVRQAQKYLDTSLSLEPRDYMTMFYKARLLDMQKEYIEAQKLYKEILKYVPEDSQVYSLYGYSLGKSGKEFEGYIALAYSSMYANNLSKAKLWITRAKKEAHTKQEKDIIKETEEALVKRKEYLKK